MELSLPVLFLLLGYFATQGSFLKMGKAKRLVLHTSSRRYWQRFKCRRQWCRAIWQAMQSRDPVICIGGLKPAKRMCEHLAHKSVHKEFFFFFMMYPGLGQLVGSIIVGYYRLQDRRVDLTKDTDSSDESSVHTPLDYDDPDNMWV